VYPSVNLNPWIFSFVLLCLLVGNLILVSMVVSVFENSFTSHEKVAMKEFELFERTGIIAAFLLIDRDDSGSLSFDEFTKFARAFAPELGDDHIEEQKKLFSLMDTGTLEEEDEIKDPARATSKQVHAAGVAGDQVLSLGEFVEGTERLSVERLFAIQPEKKSRGVWLDSLRQVVESRWWNKLLILLCIIQVPIFCCSFVSLIFQGLDGCFVRDRA
jgi:hypothetical protein